jgi:FKBP-type peptidyl-prolyl cis-trans isomerase
MINMKKVFGVVFLIGLMTLMSCGFDDVDSGPTFQEQLAIDIDLIDSYLLTNEIDAESHASGIRYTHTVLGEGESPVAGDFVVIKYKGTLLDGTFFGEDSLGITIELNDPTIDVLQILIPLMNVGGKSTVYSPSGYCFGKNAFTGIPANSNMIFEIELITIIKNAEEQLIADQNIIDEFLLESEITAEIHSSGIRYVTTLEGTGSSPTTNSQVSVKYKGTYLNGRVFDQSSNAQFFLSNLIEAWKIMIPTMKEGGKLTIYCPSEFCYGPAGNSSIPPNTILVFEIELVSVF